MRSVDGVRNVLIGSGTFYISCWISPWLGFAWDKVTGGIVYSGDFGAAILMPFVTDVPRALVALVVGLITAQLVFSTQPARWAWIPAILYAQSVFFSHHWVGEPQLTLRIGQIFGATFVGAACVAGGYLASWRPVEKVVSNALPNK